MHARTHSHLAIASGNTSGQGTVKVARGRAAWSMHSLFVLIGVLGAVLLAGQLMLVVLSPHLLPKGSFRGADDQPSWRHCTMESCFNFSSCTEDVLLFVYPEAEEQPHPPSSYYQHVLRAVRQEFAARITADPGKACLLLPSIDTSCHQSNCLGMGPRGAQALTEQLRDLPYWGSSGRNHILFEIHDHSSPVFDPQRAILLKSGFSAPFYRQNYDVSLPLYGRKRCTDEQRATLVNSRKWVASFRGRITSETHVRFKVWKACEQDSDGMYFRSSANDTAATPYADLLASSQFALVIKGNGLHSYRLLEALSCGCIPVIIADNFVLPLEDTLDWAVFSLRVPERMVASLPAMLRRLPPARVASMQRAAVNAYERHFASMRSYVRDAVGTITARVRKHAHLLSLPG
mmetsp:Transcript_45618/g.114791  ORF Transcript_45618/g.114791 Transcript_45618/m.114791 type:complete len:404 (-) Transcript_45618:63-1274(-)